MQKAFVPSALACCALCTVDSSCARWAWHVESLGKFGPNECHRHGKFCYPA